MAVLIDLQDASSDAGRRWVESLAFHDLDAHEWRNCRLTNQLMHCGCAADWPDLQGTRIPFKTTIIM